MNFSTSQHACVQALLCMACRLKKRCRFNSILVFENIANEIMVFGERRQIIVSPAFNSNQRDFARIDFLQLLALPDGDEPVFCAVQNICMAFHKADPMVGAQMISQYIFNRKERAGIFQPLF